MSTSPTDPKPQEPQLRSPTGVELVHVRDEAARSRWRSGFIGAYQTIFAGPPFYERFGPAEAEAVWHRLTRIPENITLVAVDSPGKLVGFGIGIPLVGQRDVARRLDGLVSVPHTFYLAELGVLPAYRGRGIAHRLVRARLALIDGDRFRAVVLRSPPARGGGYPLYSPLGFQDMGESKDVSNLRVDGRVTSDRRAFLHSVISQIRLDARPLPP